MNCDGRRTIVQAAPLRPVLRPANSVYGRPGLKLRLSRYDALLLFSKPVNAKFDKISWLEPRRLRLDAHRDPWRGPGRDDVAGRKGQGGGPESDLS